MFSFSSEFSIGTVGARAGGAGGAAGTYGRAKGRLTGATAYPTPSDGSCQLTRYAALGATLAWAMVNAWRLHSSQRFRTLHPPRELQRVRDDCQEFVLLAPSDKIEDQRSRRWSSVVCSTRVAIVHICPAGS